DDLGTAGLLEQCECPHGRIETSGAAPEAVVNLARSIQADSSHDGRMTLEHVEELLDAATVCMNGPRHLLRVSIGNDLGEVLAEEGLAPSDDEGRPIQFDQLVDDESPGLVGRQLGALLAASVRVTVRAGEIADAGADPLNCLGGVDVAQPM